MFWDNYDKNYHVTVSFIPNNLTNVFRYMKMVLSDCGISFKSDKIVYNTINQGSTFTSSVESTRAVKKPRKAKKSVSILKDQKQKQNDGLRCQKDSDEVRGKKVSKISKKAKLNKHSMSSFVSSNVSQSVSQNPMVNSSNLIHNEPDDLKQKNIFYIYSQPLKVSPRSRSLEHNVFKNNTTEINQNDIDTQSEGKMSKICIPNLQLNSPTDSTNVIRDVMMRISECVGSLTSERMSLNTVNQGGTHSINSIKVIKKSKNKMKSVSSLKDKKQSNGVKSKITHSQKFSDEGKGKSAYKNPKKVKLSKSKISQIISRKPELDNGNLIVNKGKEHQFNQKNISNNHFHHVQKLSQKTKSLEDSGINNITVNRNQNVVNMQNEEKKPRRYTALPSEALNEDKREYECNGEVELWSERQYNENNQFGVPARYTQSTLSSRMKQVHRPLYFSYNNRYPFVVGQSINKSHNLGVNIQQLLSLIKTKHISKHLVQKYETKNQSHCDLSIESKVSRTKSHYLSNLEEESNCCKENKSNSAFFMPKLIRKKSRKCPAIHEEDFSEENEQSIEEAKVCKYKNPWDVEQPEFEQANLNPGNLRPPCNCMPKNYTNFKDILHNILRNQYSQSRSDVFPPRSVSKKPSIFSNILMEYNSNNNINLDSNIQNYNM